MMGNDIVFSKISQQNISLCSFNSIEREMGRGIEIERFMERNRDK